jgi:hypothetical protein
MQADIDHLRLSIEREPDHWILAVQNRADGAWLYRSRATNLRLGQYVLLDFTSSELGRHIDGEDVTWVKAAQSRLPWAANL